MQWAECIGYDYSPTSGGGWCHLYGPSVATTVAHCGDQTITRHATGSWGSCAAQMVGWELAAHTSPASQYCSDGCTVDHVVGVPDASGSADPSWTCFRRAVPCANTATQITYRGYNYRTLDNSRHQTKGAGTQSACLPLPAGWENPPASAQLKKDTNFLRTVVAAGDTDSGYIWGTACLVWANTEHWTSTGGGCGSCGTIGCVIQPRPLCYFPRTRGSYRVLIRQRCGCTAQTGCLASGTVCGTGVIATKLVCIRKATGYNLVNGVAISATRPCSPGNHPHGSTWTGNCPSGSSGRYLFSCHDSRTTRADLCTIPTRSPTEAPTLPCHGLTRANYCHGVGRPRSIGGTQCRCDSCLSPLLAGDAKLCRDRSRLAC